MTIVFNLLCKAFIAILDILLLDFYLKNIYPDIYQENIKSIAIFIYMIIFIGTLLFVNDIFTYILMHALIIFLLIIIFALSYTNINDFIKKIFLFYTLIFLSKLLTTYIFSWLFNTNFFIFYAQNSLTYVSLNFLVSNYIVPKLFMKANL